MVLERAAERLTVLERAALVRAVVALAWRLVVAAARRVAVLLVVGRLAATAREEVAPCAEVRASVRAEATSGNKASPRQRPRRPPRKERMKPPFLSLVLRRITSGEMRQGQIFLALHFHET